MSLDHPPSSASRASGVLEDLFRERTRRSLFRREPAPEPARTPTVEHPAGASEAVVRPRAEWPRRRLPPWAIGAAAAVVLVAGVAGWRVLARPAPIEQRLPMTAAAESTGAAVTPGGADGGAAAAGRTTGTDGDGDAEGATGPVFVHVAGAVAAPGVVELPAASRVVDAVTAAGGLRPDADPDRVNLAAPLVDGSRVVVPAVGQESPPEMSTVPPAGVGGSGPTGADGTVATGSAAGGPIDLNRAGTAELDTLPGVGPATAQAIVDHRDTSGPFDSVDALLDVRGIGEAKLEALRDLVTVG